MADASGSSKSADPVLARIERATAAFRNAPADREVALELLSAHAGLKDMLGLREIAGDIERSAGHHAAVLAGLIWLLHRLGHKQDVERLFGVAVAAAPGDEAWHETFAGCGLQYGFREGIWPHLQHIETRGIPDKADLLLRLAAAHQEHGEHEEALRLFAVIAHVNPHFAATEELAALKAASEERKGRKAPVNSGQVIMGLRRRQQWRKVARVVPGVLALVVGAYALAAWAVGARREVWVLNGTPAVVKITLDGQPMELSAGTAERVTVGEGDHRVIGSRPGAAEERFSLRTPFWSRPFDHRVYALDPDRLAVLGRFHVQYGEDDRQKPLRREWSGGALFTELEGVDYAFEAPPSSVKFSGGRMERVVLQQFPLANLAGELKAVRAGMGDAAYLELLARWLAAASDTRSVEQIVAAACSPAEVLKLLEVRLDASPPDLNVHRAYQDAMRDAGHESELEARYAKLVAAAPKDIALRYLAARANHDEDAYDRVLTELVRDPACPVQAFVSRLTGMFSQGRFAEAVPVATALALREKDATSEFYLLLALEGAGRAAEALERVTHDSKLDPLARVSERCLLLASAGREEEAKAELRAATVRDAIDEPLRVMQAVGALIAYAAGHAEQAGKELMAYPDPLVHAEGALMMNNPAAAASAAPADMPPRLALALFLAFHLKGQDADPAAQKALAAAAAALKRENGRGGRAAAPLLLGQPGMPAARLVDLYVDYELKPVLLAVLGVLHPADRDVYFSKCRILNFRRSFPWHLVHAVVDEGAKR